MGACYISISTPKIFIVFLYCRQRLLAEVARQQGHTKVMLGVNGTRLASYVLSGMAQGRGVTVPLEVGFADDRDGDITFVRPLRYISLFIYYCLNIAEA